MRQEVNTLEKSEVAQEIVFAMNLTLYGLLDDLLNINLRGSFKKFPDWADISKS